MSSLIRENLATRIYENPLLWVSWSRKQKDEHSFAPDIDRPWEGNFSKINRDCTGDDNPVHRGCSAV